MKKTGKKTRVGVRGAILIPIVLANVVIMGLLGFIAIRQSDTNFRNLTAQIAGVAAEYAAASVDADLLPAIVPGAEDTEEYQTILNALCDVMAKNPILYAYTLTTDGTNVYNGVVAGFEEKIGTKSNVVYSHVADAFAGSSVQDNTIHETAYGMLINSYVPIKDANGKVIAILGCAYNAAEVLKDASTLNVVVNIVVAVGVILMSAVCLAVVRQVTKPLENATEILGKVRNCDLQEYSDQNIPNNAIGDIIKDSVTMSDGLRVIIHDISSLLEQMGRGNFRVETACEENYIGDYREILASIRSIRDRLRDTLSEIRISSQQVNTGAEQVAAGSQTISQGAAQQFASVDDLSGNVEHIVQQINMTAANANSAMESTRSTSDQAEMCSVHMEKMMAAMADITDKSSQINRIIKTIDDIAFQTNILALNAAVEAARAGVAGKGFAVVADEGRNLAAKSAEAAKNTTELIESTVSAVNNGTKVLTDTADTLAGVVNDSRKASDLAGQIADAAAGQATAVVQISQSIEVISGVVNSTSSTAEESAASSQELSGQATMLSGMLEQFKLRQADAYGYR